MLQICERAAEVLGGEDSATDVVAKGHERSNWSPSCCRLCSMLTNFLPAEYAAELQLTDASRAQSQRRNLIGREPPIREDSGPAAYSRHEPCCCANCAGSDMKRVKNGCVTSIPDSGAVNL